MDNHMLTDKDSHMLTGKDNHTLTDKHMHKRFTIIMASSILNLWKVHQQLLFKPSV
jgi:hypothetical protein